jgi:hypothetical protein
LLGFLFKQLILIQLLDLADPHVTGSLVHETVQLETAKVLNHVERELHSFGHLAERQIHSVSLQHVFDPVHQELLEPFGPNDWVQSFF